MANISKIELPNGTTYDIKDETARDLQLTATYTSATYDLELEVEAANSADNIEY